VVQIPHLLYRLEHDAVEVGKRIVALLTPSYFPPKKGVETQVREHFRQDYCCVMGLKTIGFDRCRFNVALN
jgi:hypothetical protein